MFSKFGAKTGATVSNKYQIQLKKSICFHPRCSVKEGLKEPYSCFPVNIATFLRKPILKNIWEGLFLKISTSMTNLLKGGGHS